MKISILLPYKENFSPTYPGAVSLFIKDTSKISKFKKNIIIFGNTKYDKKFKIKYFNLKLEKETLKSQSKSYVTEFIKIEKSDPSSIIEIHNRPIYLKYIYTEIYNPKFILYFHNDPLTMIGSKTVKDRKFLLDVCSKIIFNSNWSKKRFLQGMGTTYINSDKLLVIYQSATKKKININNKKKWITFVGKLNTSKGYDLFGKAIIKILNKYKDWKAIVIGDEQRAKISFYHKNFKILGFQPHDKVLDIFKKTNIAIACSRWNEPLGRTSIEASSNGCAVIISNKGGLPETITDAIILENLDEKTLYKRTKELIVDKKLRQSYQKLSLKNFYLTHKKSSKEIDSYREEILFESKKIYKKNNLNSSLRILHVTNFNERHDGRLFFNTGRRLNNGFIRLGHSVLEFSDRDIQKNYKSITDIDGSKNLNEKLINTCYNFRPQVLVIGHADSITNETLKHLKSNYHDLKIIQWFLDPLNKLGPDFEKNKYRVLHKNTTVDANFLTTSPDALNFLPQKKQFFYMPNPSDSSFETLHNYNHNCPMDVFFALSHGVHRGVLKRGKFDDREEFVKKLIQATPNVKFDIYGLNKIQPVWADNYFKSISNSKMGLNLSRGKPIKYYSSDRITQLIGNGLLTFIDEKTQFMDFFDNDEMVFYKDISDLSEKIQKYNTDNSERKKIAKKGKEKCMKYFNSTLVAKYLLEKTFGIKTHNKYIWDNK